MKKVFVFILAWSLLLSVPTQAKSETLSFVIENDSNTAISTIKQEIIQTINQSLQYIDETSINVYLSEDLSELENTKWEVSYQNHTLTFKVGNALGTRISGTISSNEFCLVEVKPKSFIMEWLNL